MAGSQTSQFYRIAITYAKGTIPYCLARLLLDKGSMHKTYFHIIAIMLPLAALVAAVINKLKVQVPVGYQDENGFHVGKGGTENKVNWPPFW